MPIDDIKSEGYSTIDVKAQGSSTNEVAKPSESEPQKKIASENNSKESETLENQNDDDTDLVDDEDEDSSESDDKDQQNQDKGQQKHKKSRGIEKRIKRLIKAQNDLRAENQYLREQAMRAQSQTQQAPKSESVQSSKVEGKPNPDDFDTIADYTEALTEWKFAQRQKEIEAKSSEQAKANAFNEKIKKHDERVKTFKSEAQDFDLVVQEFMAANPRFVPNQDLLDIVTDSELSAPLAYELFKNPDLLVKINQLSPAQAAREIGKLESKIERTLEEKKSKPKNTITNAPPPIAPIGASNAGAAIQKRIDQMTADEWLEHRRKLKG